MIRIRQSTARGHYNFGWLDTYHTFSFGEYLDRNYMGFRSLRVINEDRIMPDKGFAMHSHQDMEIITYVMEGTLEHKDSMGNTSLIHPDEFQHISAGTGITHSEYNVSKNEEVHLLQIWISPRQTGLAPSYEQKKVSQEEKRNRLCLVAEGFGHTGPFNIHQGLKLFICLLDRKQKIQHDFVDGHAGWVQVMRGAVRVNDVLLTAGDGAFVEQEEKINLVSEMRAEILFFDMA